MTRTLSEFHYSTHIIDAGSLRSEEALHDELAFKLGLPNGYERNWESLLDCLSSISDPLDNQCQHWEFRTGKRMVLCFHGFGSEPADPQLLLALAQVIAGANDELEQGSEGIRIWLDFTTEEQKR